MWIKTLELKNFQKHSDLKLKFTSGVNVLHGATDAGKSCVRRAISWVFFNTPQGDVVRKEGTKKTVVTVVLNNDVTIKRIKSASINAYVLVVGDEEKRFDSVGRKIPEEVVEALRASVIEINGETINLNISDQIALPFLMDKSGTFRSKLFNKLTGSEITDKVLQDLNKDILKVGRDEKAIIEDLEEKEQQAIMLRLETNRLKEAYYNLKEKYDILQEKKERYFRLSDLTNKLGRNSRAKEAIEHSLENNRKDIISTDKLRETQKSYDTLKDITVSLSTNNSLLSKLKQKASELKDFSKLPIKVLKSIWEKLDMLKKIKNKLNQNDISIEDIKLRKEKAKKTLGKWIRRYKEELKKREICPTCKQKITEKTMENLKIT